MGRFLFGVHCHQPVGNFEWVIKKVTEISYKPFLETIGRFPEVKFTLHYSGILYEFFEKHWKEFFDLVGEMVERRQVEILSGGFYEPILPVIPEDDALEQLEMMNEYIEKRFGVKPRGIWLSERVWEPHLPSLLKKAGIEYTIVDEYHFTSCGWRVEDLTFPFITENNGDRICIFPISKTLRYLVPFREIDEVVNYIKGVEGCAILADDGEKFGSWPGTYDRVYKERWLERFLERLINEGIETSTFATALDDFPKKGPCYLPPASYEEMTEWCLPTEERERVEELKHDENLSKFIKGGFFRNFFVKYPEANQLHKRMIYVSERIKDKGKKYLFMGQCNCAYWHGIFGGLYLPHLRSAVYENLIRAEREENLNKKEVEVLDFDADGKIEVILTNENLKMFISPEDGGGIKELDFYPAPFNFMAVLTRRREAYHRFLGRSESFDGRKTIHEVITAKEKDLERYLRYDRERLLMFRDRENYRWVVEKNTVRLYGEKINKEYRLLPSGFEVKYEGEVETIIPVFLLSPGVEEHEHGIVFSENEKKIRMEITWEGVEEHSLEEIWTVSSSESGMERTFQGYLLHVRGRDLRVKILLRL